MNLADLQKDYCEGCSTPPTLQCDYRDRPLGPHLQRLDVSEPRPSHWLWPRPLHRPRAAERTGQDGAVTNPTWDIRQGDSLEVMRGMEAESVHCCRDEPALLGVPQLWR